MVIITAIATDINITDPTNGGIYATTPNMYVIALGTVVINVSSITKKFIIMPIIDSKRVPKDCKN